MKKVMLYIRFIIISQVFTFQSILVLLTDISPKSITFNLSYFSLRFICMVSCKRQYGLIKVKHLFCQDICEWHCGQQHSLDELKRRLEMAELYSQQLSNQNDAGTETLQIVEQLQQERDTLNSHLQQVGHSWAFLCVCVFWVFFVCFLHSTLSVLLGHSVISSPPQRPMISDF